MAENNNREQLFKELDILLERAGDDFGPVIMDELQNRLDQTVNAFNGEVKRMLETSFKMYHLQGDQLRELIKQGAKPKKKLTRSEADEIKADIPQFISKFEDRQQ